MKSLYFDASAGISGDMMLAALLDLGADQGQFKSRLESLNLPVKINIHETKRSGLRALKVDVEVHREEHLHRKWRDVEAVILSGTFPEGVKDKALKVFRTLFEAESRVHGHAFQDTHLHEAGADDALIDIVGTCLLLEDLGIERISCSPLNLGAGTVKTSHGILPVPPPAVSELLKGVPVYSAWVEQELVTPTGAALIRTLADEFLKFPELTVEKIGYGAGGRNPKGFPNILRVFYCEEEADYKRQRLFQIEANIDDSNPEILAEFLTLSLELGALDAFLTPIVMKKNRLASKLTLLAEQSCLDSLIQSIFRETTTIGVRYFPAERRVLERRTAKVKVLGQEIGMKISGNSGAELNIRPEFSDCLKASRKTGIPLKQVMDSAIVEYYKNKDRREEPE